MIVFLNGKFLDGAKARVSVFDHGFLYGDGVYETLRTFDGQVWNLAEHLKRLKSSCNLIGIKLPWSAKQIGEWVSETVQRNGSKEARIRITITRGENGFDFVSCKKPTILIQAQVLMQQPDAVYKKGVAIVTFKAQRFLPEAKSISLLPMVMGKRYSKRKNAYEAVFVDDDYVLEGTITNIFIVRDGVLWTPKQNVLAGTTRAALLKIAKNNGFTAFLRDFKIRDLYLADEVFLTNAPKGVIPVVRVDGQKIGNGKPGSVTKEFLNFYRNACT